MDCSAALERIKEDRPITIKDGISQGNTSKAIADIVSVRFNHHDIYIYSDAEFPVEMKRNQLSKYIFLYSSVQVIFTHSYEIYFFQLFITVMDTLRLEIRAMDKVRILLLFYGTVDCKESG